MDTNVDQKRWQNTRKVIVRRESWRYYWLFFLTGMVLLVFTGILSLYSINLAKIIAIVAGMFWFCHFLVRLWFIYSCKYVVDKDVLKISRGMIFPKVREVSINDITDIVFKRSHKEKFLDVGSLYIEVNNQETDYLISGVSDPEDIKRHILKVQDMKPSTVDHTPERN